MSRANALLFHNNAAAAKHTLNPKDTETLGVRLFFSHLLDPEPLCVACCLLTPHVAALPPCDTMLPLFAAALL